MQDLHHIFQGNVTRSMDVEAGFAELYFFSLVEVMSNLSDQHECASLLMQVALSAFHLHVGNTRVKGLGNEGVSGLHNWLRAPFKSGVMLGSDLQGRCLLGFLPAFLASLLTTIAGHPEFAFEFSSADKYFVARAIQSGLLSNDLEIQRHAAGMLLSSLPRFPANSEAISLWVTRDDLQEWLPDAILLVFSLVQNSADEPLQQLLLASANGIAALDSRDAQAEWSSLLEVQGASNVPILADVLQDLLLCRSVTVQSLAATFLVQVTRQIEDPRHVFVTLHLAEYVFEGLKASCKQMVSAGAEPSPIVSTRACLALFEILPWILRLKGDECCARGANVLIDCTNLLLGGNRNSGGLMHLAFQALELVFDLVADGTAGDVIRAHITDITDILKKALDKAHITPTFSKVQWLQRNVAKACNTLASTSDASESLLAQAIRVFDISRTLEMFSEIEDVASQLFDLLIELSRLFVTMVTSRRISLEACRFASENLNSAIIIALETVIQKKLFPAPFVSAFTRSLGILIKYSEPFPPSFFSKGGLAALLHIYPLCFANADSCIEVSDTKTLCVLRRNLASCIGILMARNDVFTTFEEREGYVRLLSDSIQTLGVRCSKGDLLNDVKSGCCSLDIGIPLLTELFVEFEETDQLHLCVALQRALSWLRHETWAKFGTAIRLQTAVRLLWLTSNLSKVPSLRSDYILLLEECNLLFQLLTPSLSQEFTARNVLKYEGLWEWVWKLSAAQERQNCSLNPTFLRSLTQDQFTWLLPLRKQLLVTLSPLQFSSQLLCFGSVRDTILSLFEDIGEKLYSSCVPQILRVALFVSSDDNSFRQLCALQFPSSFVQALGATFALHPASWTPSGGAPMAQYDLEKALLALEVLIKLIHKGLHMLREKTRSSVLSCTGYLATLVLHSSLKQAHMNHDQVLSASQALACDALTQVFLKDSQPLSIIAHLSSTPVLEWLCKCCDISNVCESTMLTQMESWKTLITFSRFGFAAVARLVRSQDSDVAVAGVVGTDVRLHVVGEKAVKRLLLIPSPALHLEVYMYLSEIVQQRLQNEDTSNSLEIQDERLCFHLDEDIGVTVLEAIQMDIIASNSAKLEDAVDSICQEGIEFLGVLNSYKEIYREISCEIIDPSWTMLLLQVVCSRIKNTGRCSVCVFRFLASTQLFGKRDTVHIQIGGEKIAFVAPWWCVDDEFSETLILTLLSGLKSVLTEMLSNTLVVNVSEIDCSCLKHDRVAQILFECLCVLHCVTWKVLKLMGIDSVDGASAVKECLFLVKHQLLKASIMRSSKCLTGNPKHHSLIAANLAKIEELYASTIFQRFLVQHVETRHFNSLDAPSRAAGGQ